MAWREREMQQNLCLFCFLKNNFATLKKFLHYVFVFSAQRYAYVASTMRFWSTLTKYTLELLQQMKKYYFYA